MNISQTEYRALLEQAFPEETLRAFMRAVTEGYRLAPIHCRKHYSELAGAQHDILGHHRRAAISDLLSGVAERYNLHYKEEANECRNAYFLSVFSGRFRLICCLAPAKGMLPRQARIRRFWSRHNAPPQTSLFGQYDSIPADPVHLAILTHAPRGRRRDEAAFVDIVVPDQHCRRYIDRMELFSMFAAETAAYRASLAKRKKDRRSGTA